MRSLLDISADFQALDDLLEELGGDVSDPQVEAMLDAWLAEITDDRDTKVDGYAAYIRELTIRADALKQEAARLTARRNSYENAAQHLKDRLKYVYQTLGWKTVKGLRFTVTLSQNGGKVPLELLVEDATELPEEFQRVTVEPNNDAIRTMLEAGEYLDFARLGERGSSIRIR